jgi:hypothetical protein
MLTHKMTLAFAIEIAMQFHDNSQLDLHIIG